MGHSTKDTWIDYGLLIGLAAIWGSSFIFIKVAVTDIPPYTMTVFRLAVPAVLLALLLLACYGIPRLDAKTWGLMVLAGILGSGLPFALIAWGQQEVEPGLTAILMAVMPLLTIGLAHFFTADEKFTVFKVVGVGLGIFGVILLMGPAALFRTGSDFIHQLSILGGAMCYAVNALITKQLMQLRRLTVAAVGIGSGCLLLMPFALWLEGPFHLNYPSDALAASVLLGLVHTALAAFVLYAIIARRGASFFSQINLLIPLFGVFWAFLIFSEEPAINAFIALFVILAGFIVAQQTPKRLPEP